MVGVSRDEFPALVQQLVPADDFGVIEPFQTVHVEYNDQTQIRDPRFDFEELVELLVVLDEQRLQTGVGDNVLALGRRVGLVDAGDSPAQTLAGHVGVDPLLAVLGQNADPAAPAQPPGGKPASHRRDRLAVVVPAEAVPDAQMLFHVRGLVTQHAGPREEKLAQRVAAVELKRAVRACARRAEPQGLKGNGG